MNKLIRSVITGTLIGAGIGAVMLIMRNRNQKMTAMSPKLNQRARGTIGMVKDNAMRWTSAFKNGTEAFSRKLARRSS